jgi:hypothetical protein
MISTRITATVAVGALAVGILTGAAGTIVARDTAPQASDWAAHMSQMSSMVSIMAGQGGMMNGQNGIAPAASLMPDWMQQHHVTISPVPAP